MYVTSLGLTSTQSRVFLTLGVGGGEAELQVGVVAVVFQLERAAVALGLEGVVMDMLIVVQQPAPLEGAAAQFTLFGVGPLALEGDLLPDAELGAVARLRGFRPSAARCPRRVPACRNW